MSAMNKTEFYFLCVQGGKKSAKKGLVIKSRERNVLKKKQTWRAVERKVLQRERIRYAKCDDAGRGIS